MSFNRQHQRLPSQQRINITRIELTVASFAANQIQRAYRGHLIRHTCGVFLVRLFLQWVVTIQSIYRSRKIRLFYKLILYECLLPIQKCLRGYLVRRELKKIRKVRLTAFRAQVFELWRRSYTPLAYRVKFWMFINRYRFLHLSLHEDELIKLWRSLGLKPLDYRNNDNGCTHSSCFDYMEQRLGGKTKAVFHRFLIVQRRLDSVKTDPNKLELHPVFPAEFSLLKDAPKSSHPTAHLSHKALALKQARDKLIVEREEIFKTLKICKRTNPEIWERLYSSLKIPDTVLQKKRKVVKMLWEHPSYAKTSLQVYFMMESYTNGDMVASRLETPGTGRPSSGVTEEYTAKMIYAREANISLKRNQMRIARRTKTTATGCTPINTDAFLRHRAAMKLDSTIDQRFILIDSFLSCGSKTMQSLLSRAASLRRINRRKKMSRNRRLPQSSPRSDFESRPVGVSAQATSLPSERLSFSPKTTTVRTTSFDTYSKEEQPQRLMHATSRQNGHADTSRRTKSVADLRPQREIGTVGGSDHSRWRLGGSPSFTARKVS